MAIAVVRRQVEQQFPRRPERRDSAAPYPRQQDGQHTPRFLFSEQVVTLSTIKRQTARSPLLSLGLMRSRKRGASVVNAHTVMESVSQSGRLEESPPDAAFQCSPYRQKRSKSRRASLPAPIRDRIDKVLILLGMRTPGNSQRLPTCFRYESGRAHVGNPDLDGP